MICNAPHPWYGSLGKCELEAGHRGLHRIASLSLPATGGWFGACQWDETSVFNELGELGYAGPAHLGADR